MNLADFNPRISLTTVLRIVLGVILAYALAEAIATQVAATAVQILRFY